jgi:hypothetical protein
VLELAVDAPLFLMLIAAAWLALHGDKPCRLFLFAGVGMMISFLFLSGLAVRFLIPLLPFFFLAVARVLQRLGQKRPAIAVLALVYLLTLYGTEFYRQFAMYHPRTWNSLALNIKEHLGSNDVVVFYPGLQQFEFDYFARKVGLRAEEIGFPKTIYEEWRGEGIKGYFYDPPTLADVDALCASLKARPHLGRIWLVTTRTDKIDSGGVVDRRLSQMGDPQDVHFAEAPTPNSLVPVLQMAPPRLIRIDVNRE